MTNISALPVARPTIFPESKRPDRGGHIRIEKVSVFFNGGAQPFVAVSDVSLDIRPGEFVALLGPSGCGKSTLLNLMAGFLKPSQGKVWLDGEPLRQPTPRCTVVFQQHSLFPWMTALGNVAFGPQQAAVPNARERALELLGQVGLREHANKYPAQLSGGQRQRVGLARALIMQPDVLLLDEPFGALDAMTRTLMQEQLLQLWARDGSTTVFITHDLDEALFLADRVAVMSTSPGRIREWVQVDLPRPRTPDVRRHPRFQALHERVARLVREESLRVFTEE